MWSKYVGRTGIIRIKCGVAGARRFVMLGNKQAGYFYMDERAARQLISLVERGLEEIETKISVINEAKEPS